MLSMVPTRTRPAGSLPPLVALRASSARESNCSAYGRNRSPAWVSRTLRPESRSNNSAPSAFSRLLIWPVTLDWA